MISTMERLLLPAVFLLYVGVALLWPSWRVWRRTGQSPYVLPNSDDAHGFVTRGFRLVMLGLAGYVLVQAAWPRIDVWLGTVPGLTHPAVSLIGWSGLAIALLWTVIAQYQMGLSWRIGIDRAQATALVTSGLFGYSRNPIFLAMRASLFSVMLLRPNAVTVALWLVGDILMQFQVRLEEAYLAERHGTAYVAYAARVRRWL